MTLDSEWDSLADVVQEWGAAHPAVSFVALLAQVEGAGWAYAVRGPVEDETLTRHFADDVATMALCDEVNMQLAGHAPEPLSDDPVVECATEFLEGLERYTLHDVGPERLAFCMGEGIRREFAAIAAEEDGPVSPQVARELYLVRLRKLLDAAAILREADWLSPALNHPGLEER